MTNGYSIATLVVFILSIAFVIHPIKIPTRISSVPHIPLNLTTAPILAIAILWAAQCINPTVIKDGIVGTDGVKPYNILILFFTLAYMAITLDVSGILQAAAFWVSNKGGSNGWKLYFYFYIMLTLLSILLGNDPIILSGTAFLVYYTHAANLEPMPWLMAEFAAANTASMVLFVGNPTNVVICEGFSVNDAAFTAYTILPFLACNVVCFIALAGQYRSEKHVPRRLVGVPKRNPRSVLSDPVGALVGSFLLGSALVVCLVVSFFGVDVWKISLPFAVAKFIFDISWDHYKHTHHIRASGRGQNAEDVLGSIVADKKAAIEALENGPEEEPQLPSLVLHSTTDRASSFPTDEETAVNSPQQAPDTLQRTQIQAMISRLQPHFHTFFTALPRLPFALVPFAFSQFILIEALAHQGWVDIFANWLVKATHKEIHSTIWLIGIVGVILCNLSGTNIGATILLTKIVRASALPPHSDRAAAIALAVASNIGAVSFTFSASLAGLLWKGILKQKGIVVKQREFAYWNCLPLLVMTVAGLAVVCAEMAVLY
ncbi:hypothetical protein V8B97DRAFT_2020839 [Scleroderma yunnanense]